MILRIATTFLILCVFSLVSYFLIFETSIQTKIAGQENCTLLLLNTKTLKFVELFLKYNETEHDFAVVVPEGITLINVPLDIFCPLLELLSLNQHIIAAAGATVTPVHPVCKLVRQKWTVRMFRSYTSYTLSLKSGILYSSDECYACDLLPDLFVVNLKKLRKYARKLAELVELGESAHLPFFLLFQRRSAFCPKLKIKTSNSALISKDLTCNNLSSRWDERVAFVPKVTNIYRLITPDNLELWLGCLWAKKVYDLQLPIHCSNFVRRYLYDIVDIIENVYHLDYRVLWGTVIGALRHKDVIPWTVDSDIYIFLPEKNFTRLTDLWWSTIVEFSSRRYSYKSRYNMLHYSPVRAFPMCPVLLEDTTPEVRNMTRNQLIDDVIKNNRGETSFGDHWRNFGYVDLYDSEDLTKCVKNYLDEKAQLVQIGYRFFKTVGRANESIVCEYGDKVFSTFPNESLDFRSFLD